MAGPAIKKTLLSEEEYLHAHFEGERTPEYIDGQLVERTMPNNFHSEAQGELTFRFRSIQEKHSVFARPEIRLRVAEGRYRIADVAVFFPQAPQSAIPEEIPYMVTEIVSPDDTWLDTMARLRDYHHLGVVHIWLVDLQARQLATFTGHSVELVATLELPQFGFSVKIDDLLKAA